MFNNPIMYTRLKNLDELLNFSLRTDSRSERAKTYTTNNGQVAFTSKYGYVYVTPYRPEILSILEKEGYSESFSLFVPYSNGEKRPDEYVWLAKIAELECWAYTHEKAWEVALEKGIDHVHTDNSLYQIKEISYFYDESAKTTYSSMCMKYLHNNSRENIGTYIIVNDKTILICDEYGRTFLVKSKKVINDLVNDLIVAGYRHNSNPYYYVHFDNEVEEA